MRVKKYSSYTISACGRCFSKSTANNTDVTKSDALYNAYCNLTINNTDENEIVGRIITYMNDSMLDKDGHIVSTTTINGGTF